MKPKTQLWRVVLVLAVAAIAPAGASAGGPEPSSCDAPFLGNELSMRGPAGKQDWSGVATSRKTVGVIALWSDTQVVISRDDGRTFQKLNARFEHIEDVVVGASGTVFVLDGNTISMAFTRGHVRRVPVPVVDPEGGEENIRLVVGGGYLAHVSRAGLALTKDYGASWQIQAFPDGWVDAVELNIERDGTLDTQVTIFNCHSGDYDLFYRGSVDGPFVETEDASGWAGRQKQPHVVEIPEGLWPMAVDRCGHLLGLHKDRLVRWTPSTGWRQLDVTTTRETR